MDASLEEILLWIISVYVWTDFLLRDRASCI